MALDVATVVSMIAQAAQWRETVADADGVYHYFLEDGLDLNIQSPDGRTCIFSADLGSLNDENTVARDDELTRIGQLIAATVKTRASVLSLHDGRLELHRSVYLPAVSERQIVAHAQEFLNDQAWWKQNLRGDNATTASSGFSMSSGWFLGELTF